MLDLIQATYAEPVTLHTLAAVLGRQPAYLGRLFRRTVGMTVHDCLTRIRLARAEKMIRDGVKIEAVALSVGYRSKKNFYRQFKRRYEMTPERYGCSAGLEVGRRAAVALNSSRRALADKRLIGMIQLAARVGRATLRVAIQHFADSPLAMLVTDEGGRYSGANRAALALTGYTVAELRDLGPDHLFAGAPAGAASDTRCLWQTVQPAPRGPSNAVMRCKADELVAVQVMNVRNLLWGCPEMAAISEELAAPPVPALTGARNIEGS